ncbi:MAG: hotdog fold thioesterase [Saprospiraceae bacterium]|nr:hotdog fold thioesterase [Saprospiraceae bacterium]
MIFQNKDIDYLNNFSKNTLVENLGIVFTDIGDDWLEAKMEVCEKTIQPYGAIHGGASLALAETVGGGASALVLDREKYIANGVEINGNHLRPVRNGFVTARATILHKGERTHVWEIKITDDEGNLISVCRLTNIVIKIEK